LRRGMVSKSKADVRDGTPSNEDISEDEPSGETLAMALAETMHSEKILKELLHKRDEGLLSAPNQDQSCGVEISFNVRLYKLCEVKQAECSYTVDLGVHCHWIDKRLKNIRLKTHHHIDYSRVWKPNWRAEGMTDELMVSDENVELIDAESGKMQHYKRFRASFDCDLDLPNFPFDQQTFFVIIRVPRNHKQGIGSVIVHGGENDYKSTTIVKHNCSVAEGFTHHVEYYVTRLQQSVRYAGDKKDNAAGLWNKARHAVEEGGLSGPAALKNRKPEVVIEIHTDRRQQYWLFVIILPNLLIALTGCFAFLIEPSKEDDKWFGDRLDIIVTLILTFIAFKFSISERLPVLPYLTLLDKWLLCMFAAFIMSGLECAVIQVLLTKYNVNSEDLRTVDIYAAWVCALFILGTTIWLVGIPRWRTRGCWDHHEGYDVENGPIVNVNEALQHQAQQGSGLQRVNTVTAGATHHTGTSEPLLHPAS